MRNRNGPIINSSILLRYLSTTRKSVDVDGIDHAATTTINTITHKQQLPYRKPKIYPETESISTFDQCISSTTSNIATSSITSTFRARRTNQLIYYYRMPIFHLYFM
jgi:hypothetical protein